MISEKNHKVLHVTNWYFSHINHHRVPFIKEHFKALNLYSDGELVHVEVQDSQDVWFSINYDKLSSNEESFVIQSRLQRWIVKELLTTFLLIYVLFKKRSHHFDVIIVHEAYPLLTFYHYWKKLFKTPLVIIEHWTAFHYNFNLPRETNKLSRVKHIFSQGIPLITVSNRLKKDIQEFCDTTIQAEVIPNVVRKNIFHFSPEKIMGKDFSRFFMLNYWREIKDPFPILWAFKEYVQENPNVSLRIGGFGPLWQKMEEFVRDNHLENNIELLGPLDKTSISKELNQSSAFIHTADYETFSVVCAEAISCGCPVIVKKLEAITEFINDQNGILVDSDKDWLAVLRRFDPIKYDRRFIATEANNRFDSAVVGKELHEFVTSFIR